LERSRREKAKKRNKKIVINNLPCGCDGMGFDVWNWKNILVN
jgi:hypothetical protein